MKEKTLPILGLLLLTIHLLSHLVTSATNDAVALLTLKQHLDPLNKLPWRAEVYHCKWAGVKQCLNGRVSKLVLEFQELNGTLESQDLTLTSLDELRVLSFKGNSLSGSIPDLSGLVNLKSLFLNKNQFSGELPATISGLHRLKIVVLSDNQLSGGIPVTLVNLRRLYTLLLDNNRLVGQIPALNQSVLTFFNVSGNQLSGQIPATQALSRFNISSFSGNLGLCGEIIRQRCNNSGVSVAPSPIYPSQTRKSHTRSRDKMRIIFIVVGSALGGVSIFALSLLLFCLLSRKRSRRESGAIRTREVEKGAAVEDGAGEGDNGQKNFQWDQDCIGKLVFVGGAEQAYSLEDLLKASAEILGRGSLGSTYKAVMESGFIVTVKRLKNCARPGADQFEMQMEVVGRVRHPNLVRLRAYFQAKEERLLVYDYFPNGSLFSLIHGTRSSGGKPLHWTSCLKIAEDVATALAYLHHTAGLAHGNLKSSNVLLGPDFESCLTDYALFPFRPVSIEEGPSLFYRPPEFRFSARTPTMETDIYAFGVLLLELLTGRAPFQDMVPEDNADISVVSNWVRRVREEEREMENSGSGNEGSDEKLVALLSVAVACLGGQRPAAGEVARMVGEARAEAQGSSQSSEQSPGRWSDTVQSLPRESGSEHHSFTERD
ncbi:inactive leucine-rich repeat receptor-like serine/threonine-protein kinase At1g60630 [Amborella trichopoda]|uniref:Protein kinase domain-containing protein n=1 Tax=Amborella trichopoda TaxID=13333 RepID=W1PP02_AMBTC|nr:inactive leucine-rich repeat receptor-like serine/threonine-protein kinase At1g60630 [Amborella trichopoda]XP_020525299.1 inactive leucine-rich repeat receptor-like serine/threonine-protein kinase At1g60630 [Amborella trichopoda]XP_020525300.1 inactive leucine-rich repeat receptor-like serine/threonine-protein kinase At1g60630 [Amborella trichopoda]ERN09539.1 hypothetical protein AMTR_s00029p00145660 [Amborella trichopoda]|eukprot:XP_006847958.1 inactive leucine-rich repeat receptor-like serine/threonine-protein kinase At1g60630 [Amborella trichopoda]